MRSLVLAIALALCAFTQDIQPSTDWALLSAMISGDNTQQRIEQVISHGADEATARRLIAYVDGVTKVQKDQFALEMKQRCENRDIYTSNREAFAKALERWERLEQAFYRNALDHMPSDLKPVSTALIAEVPAQDVAKYEEISAPDLIRDTRYDVAALFERSCEGYEVKTK